ncbi:MAG TPA: M14-type cytosolic carboxypeptidase [Casimicrobiaceae bacterium]|nr:M14-type cytosolic carboxypeptidase [Casimicrobiaceae bacterium]
MTLKISSAFDSGAIEVVSAERAHDIQVNIRSDSHADFRQWFHFRLQGSAGEPCRIRFLNAAKCTYVDGWRDYRAVATYDGARWFRVPTSFDGTEMVIEHVPRRDSVYYAYFEPYSWQRHLDLLGRMAGSPRVQVRDLGSSLEGRELSMATVGSAGSGKRPLWIIARQHPGETMAEWFVEGLLERLVDDGDPVARALLDGAVLHVVPNMNPDGSVRGNLRTNAAGANLNREWMAPTLERSPEVLHVRTAMRETGVAAFLDVHGDEALPYVFVDGCERLPRFTERQRALQEAFVAAFKRASPDFQDVHGYPDDKETKVNLTLASKHVGDAFGCLALTLEMPFKDNADRPDPEVGWNGERSKRLGAAAVEALLDVLPKL